METAMTTASPLNNLIIDQHRAALKRIQRIALELEHHPGELISVRPYQEPILIGTVGTGILHVDARRQVILPVARYVVPEKETRDYLVKPGPIDLSGPDFLSLLAHESDEDRIIIGDLEVLTSLPRENYNRLCELFRALDRDISHPYLEAKRLKEANGW